MSSIYAGASIGVGAPLAMEELSLGGSIGDAHDKLKLAVGELHSAVDLCASSEVIKTLRSRVRR